MKILSKVLFVVFSIFIITVSAYAEPTQEIKIGENGEYGTIYGTERDPENGDTSKWLTVQTGDSGVRIVGNEGKEIVAVDKFGGIYINGDMFLNGNLKLNGKNIDMGQPLRANGFMYLLIVICLGLNIIQFIKIKNRK